MNKVSTRSTFELEQASRKAISSKAIDASPIYWPIALVTGPISKTKKLINDNSQAK
jgi:hypothetical protein